METISIAFVIDESFVMPLAVALQSLYDHFVPVVRPSEDSSEPCDAVHIYVVDIDLSEESKSLLKGILKEDKFTISFIPHEGTCPQIAKLKLPNHFPSLSKILYLDADILVRSNICTLWNLMKDAPCLAAAVNYPCQQTPDFNAGVMLLNLDYIRKEELVAKMLNYIMEKTNGNLDISIFPSKAQDVLNHFFNSWKKIPLNWNTPNFRIRDTNSQNGLFSEMEYLESNADLVHFTGASAANLNEFNPNCPIPIKPWSDHLAEVSDTQSHPMWLPYIYEWYYVLQSIPSCRIWRPYMRKICEKLHSNVDDQVEKMENALRCLKEKIPNENEHPRLLAVLLPITSRGERNVDKQLSRLRSLVAKFPTRETRFYLAIDSDDIHYASSNSEQEQNRRNDLEECFTVADIPFHIEEFPPEPAPAICKMVNVLAKKARNDCFYYLLLGDDITIYTPTQEIMPLLYSSFSKIALRHPNLPYGFGCVAFHDTTSVGFPTFPIVTNIHLDIFDEWCPNSFVNQDADPYLFELYRCFNASIFNKHLKLKNEIGGANGIPRYGRVHICWQDELLESSIKKIKDKFKHSFHVLLPMCLRLDIIVPSFRCPKDILERIIQLPIPPHVSTTVIIILDMPGLHSEELRHELEKRYGEKVRIRVNSENRGASYSRSKGLNESAAEWILYLDDDVIPEENLLYVIAEEIYQTGHNYAGYVGVTNMSPQNTSEMTIYAKGVLLVHLLHFWADHVKSGRLHAPWGITVQLVLKRTKLRFNEVFPRTGGGEDIDLCLRTCRLLDLKLKNLPEARCSHPWWDQGYVCSSRFRGWAQGDSILVDLYPEHCYYSFPNGLEMMLFATVCHIVVGFLYMTFGELSSLVFWLKSWIIFILITFSFDVLLELWSIQKEAKTYLPDVQGFDRLWCGLVGIILYRICGADIGHVLMPLYNRGSLKHICKRFDWWCGLYPEKKESIRQRERVRFLVFSAVWIIVISVLYKYYNSFYL